MSLKEYTFEYHRNLPHIQPEGATFFVTFRLHGSIPATKLIQWREEHDMQEAEIVRTYTSAEKQKDKLYELQRRQFGRMDTYLDSAVHGPTWLTHPAVAKIVVDSFHHFDNKRYRLDALTIMSNHGHAVLSPHQKDDGSFYALKSIMHSIKSYSANEGNKALKRSGRFWQDESYDHFVRDTDEWGRIVQYVLNNPVKAGLVSDWREWRWSYYRYA